MDDAKWPHARLARRTLLSAGAASLGLGVAGIGHAAEELRIAYFNDFAPVSYLDGDVMKGVLVDTFDEVLGKRLAVPLHHDGLPWVRAQDQVRKGADDAFCTTRTEARTEYVNFGTEPVVSMRYVVFYAKTSPKAEEIRKIATLEDLGRFSQGDFLGNGFAEVTFKTLKIDWAPSLEQVFNKLVAGRNDIAVAAELVGKWTARKVGVADQLDIQPLNFIPPSDFYFAIRKSFPDNEALSGRIDAALKAARGDGTVKAIEAKYA
jgi:polar amino acid transport system substrate-binding protein